MKEKKRLFTVSKLAKTFDVIAMCAIEYYIIFLILGYLRSIGAFFTIEPDDFYYQMFLNYGERMISVGVLLAIGFVPLLVFEFFAAGHSKGKEEISLIWIDKIPFDILTLIQFIIFGTFGATADSIYLWNPYGIFILDALMAGWSLLFFFYLMSIARRVKAHALWQNNVITFLVKKCIQGGRFIGSIIPSFVNKLILLAILIFSQIFYACFMASAMSGLDLNIYIIFSIVVDAVILYAFWMQKIIFDAVAAIKNGDFTAKIPDETRSKMKGSYRVCAENLNSISDGVQAAAEEKIKSEHLKTELITNVSHDIKTPLTSIISYVDLLNKEHSEEEEKEYLEVLTRQTARLKKLTEDVLEASKADSGNIEVHIEKTSVSEIIGQALAEYEEKLNASGIESIVSVPESLYVMADGRELWRVLRNLLSNVAKYSVPNSRVYIDGRSDGKNGIIEIKNISKEKLNITPDELMERFVRGDSSRHSEGSGLGLDIAKSLMTLMGGDMKLIIDGDLFKVILCLPLANE